MREACGGRPSHARVPPAIAPTPREPRRVAELLLDAQQLVVLGDAIGPRGRAGLQLAGVHRDGEVGDGRVLGLAGAVRDDGAVARARREPDRVERLGERADLVQLDEDRVRDALVDAALQQLGVRHEHVVTDELDAAARAAR